MESSRNYMQRARSYLLLMGDSIRDQSIGLAICDRLARVKAEKIVGEF